MKTVLLKLFWFLIGACTNCGGYPTPHIDGKYYCDQCGRES